MDLPGEEAAGLMPNLQRKVDLRFILLYRKDKNKETKIWTTRSLK